MWIDSEDPYTKWWDEVTEKGALFGGDSRLDALALLKGFEVPPISQRVSTKVYALDLRGLSVVDIPNLELLMLSYLKFDGSDS